MKGSDQVTFAKALGEIFRAERLRQKLSQNRLSEMANVARTGIIMFERGDRFPTIHICKAIADALGVALSTLVKRAEKLVKTPE